MISELKIIRPNHEEIKVAADGSKENSDVHKVFNKRSTRGTSAMKVLISGYNQNKYCLYFETIE